MGHFWKFTSARWKFQKLAEGGVKNFLKTLLNYTQKKIFSPWNLSWNSKRKTEILIFEKYKLYAGESEKVPLKILALYP